MTAKEGVFRRFGHWLRALPRLPRLVGIGWVIYLTSQANIIRALGSTVDGLIALQTATSHARVIEVLGAWTADDRAHFAAHLPFDVVHPLIYSTVLALSLAWGFRTVDVPRRFDAWLCLPFLAGVCDELENFAHYVAVNATPNVPFWTFALGSPASMTKWAIAVGGLVALIVLVIVGFKRRHSSPPEEPVS